MRDLSSFLRALLRQKEAMTYTPQAEPKFEQPVQAEQVEQFTVKTSGRPSAEDVREALGFKRDDETIQVRMIPAPDLAKHLSSGQGFNAEEFMRALKGDGVTAGGNWPKPGNVVEANIPHAGDDPANLEEVAALEEQIKKDESEARYAAGNGYAQNIANEVLEELGRAVKAHGSMQSSHEGYAVILEELDELWDYVKTKNGGYSKYARQEAIQVAAMAMRFVLDLDPGEENTDESFGDDSDTMDPEA